jgi:hypothetical protein
MPEASNETMYVVPKKGLSVPYPQSREHLPAEGATVPRESYWLRRVTEGDVVEGQAPVKTPVKKD